jgi:hypothetical protein
MIAVSGGLSQRRGQDVAARTGPSGRNDHLSNTVEVLAGDRKGVIDPIQGPLVGEYRLEPIWMSPEEFHGFTGFVVRTANVKEGEFFAPHCRTVQGYKGG